jgi:hypothetical protein
MKIISVLVIIFVSFSLGALAHRDFFSDNSLTWKSTTYKCLDGWGKTIKDLQELNK